MAGQGSEIRAGRAYVELSTKDSAFRKGLRNATSMLKSFGTGLVAVGGIAAAAGAAIAAPIAVGVKGLLDLGDELDKTRQRTGLSVEALSELGHAAEQSGTDLATVEGAVAKMQKGLAAGNKAFAKLGLNIEQLKKLSPEAQFNAVTAAINKISDPSKRAAAAMEVFGKSGTQLLPMIEDLDALRNEAREMGFVMSGETAASAVRLGDMIANLMKSVKFAGMALAEIFLPAIEATVAVMQHAITASINWVRENVNLTSSLGGIVDALKAGEFQLAGEIAMAALNLAILKGLDTIVTAVGGEWGDFIGSLGQSLLDGNLAEAWGTLMDGIVHATQGAIKAVIGGWQKAVTTIAKFLLNNPIGRKAFGIDEEQARAEALRPQEIAALEATIAAKRSNAAKLEASGGGERFRFGAGTKSELEVENEQIKELEARIARLKSESPDVLNDAMNFAGQNVASQADAMRAAVDEASKRLAERTQGGAGRVSGRVTAAQAELDRLSADAAKLREEKEAEDKRRGAGAGAGFGSVAGSVAGTFSAAAAVAMGGARNPVNESNEILRRQENLQKRIAKAAEQGKGLKA